MIISRNDKSENGSSRTDGALNEIKKIISDCISESEIQHSLNEKVGATRYLSQGARLVYLLVGLENSSSGGDVLRKTLDETMKQSAYWRRNLPSAVIHSRTPQESERILSEMKIPPRDKSFWKGYLHAECWDNGTALSIFAEKLSGANTLELHWYGNLLSKLGKFEQARAPLELAQRDDPWRYNHYSHLGNVYRALGMKKEAKKQYKSALALLDLREKWGRVEYIHAVRCYHGLAQLGISEYAHFEKEATALAIESGKVSLSELERIKF